MKGRVLNRELLPGNACFGCGHRNPHGIGIEVFEAGAGPSGLTARFEPPPRAGGFPGLTHGGALFTAMDCLATWVVLLRGPQDDRYWLLGSSEVSFRRGARVGEPLRLVGRLLPEEADAEGPGGEEALLVRVVTENEGGQRVAEARFREVPVSAEKLRSVAGIREIPDAWRSLVEREREAEGGER